MATPKKQQNDGMTVLSMELRKLGLNDNESRIYLAVLRTESMPIGELAKETGLTRPTVYRIVDALIEKGVIQKTGRQSTLRVIAESPDNLLGLLHVEKRRIEEREREFLRIIANLKSISGEDSENHITTHDGADGKNSLIRDCMTLSDTAIDVLFLDDDDGALSTKELSTIYKTLKKQQRAFTVTEHRTNTSTQENSLSFVQQQKYSTSTSAPFTGTVIIAKKIYIFQKDRALLIENTDIVALMRSMLLLR